LIPTVVPVTFGDRRRRERTKGESRDGRIAEEKFPYEFVCI
jgi:hypothetical protein